MVAGLPPRAKECMRIAALEIKHRRGSTKSKLEIEILPPERNNPFAQTLAERFRQYLRAYVDRGVDPREALEKAFTQAFTVTLRESAQRLVEAMQRLLHEVCPDVKIGEDVVRRFAECMVDKMLEHSSVKVEVKENDIKFHIVLAAKLRAEDIVDMCLEELACS